jgi:hypothetical protein
MNLSLFNCVIINLYGIVLAKIRKKYFFAVLAIQKTLKFVISQKDI